MSAPRALAGRVVAVTGGARGIGRATAEALVGRGARVAIGDLDAALAERTAAEIGGGVVALGLDVTDRDSFTRFLDRVEERLGPLEVLVNNAGIMPIGRLTDETDATTRRMVDVNLHGVLLGSKLALDRMLPRRSGHLVNIASQAGRAGFAGGATYCATKHAVVGLCESLDDELRGSGVLVSCVMPGVVNTELTAGFPSVRLTKVIEPTDVADALVAALERPRLWVHVPKSMRSTVAITRMLPRRVRELFVRAVGGDQVLLHADLGERARYEERVRPGRDKVGA